MTYFHINLDPRGKKKKVLPPILIPVIILEIFFSFFFISSPCFSERAFKDTSSGRKRGRSLCN